MIYWSYTFINSTLDSRGLSNRNRSKKFSSIGRSWASLKIKIDENFLASLFRLFLQQIILKVVPDLMSCADVNFFTNVKRNEFMSSGLLPSTNISDYKKQLNLLIYLKRELFQRRSGKSAKAISNKLSFHSTVNSSVYSKSFALLANYQGLRAHNLICLRREYSRGHLFSRLF